MDKTLQSYFPFPMISPEIVNLRIPGFVWGMNHEQAANTWKFKARNLPGLILW